jgi:hypothetical protein
MCLLTYLPAGMLPDITALLTGAAFNPDGHGFAIVDSDQLIVRRGLDGPQLIDVFAVLRHRHRHGPALFHSRFATHGVRSIDNCHPFPIGADPRTVIAHNGVLPKAVQPAGKDPRSDTRIAAEDFLPMFGPLRQRRVRRRFEQWMTPDNLAVVLTVDPRFRQRGYILNEQSGIWDDGIWYSNDGYLPAPAPRWSSIGELGPGRPMWDDLEIGAARCGYCYAVVGDPLGECPSCGWCLDCDEPPGDCLCHLPAVLDARRTRPA